MSMWYYAAAGNARQGPVESAELVRLRLQGALDWETLLWREGMADWQPMRDFAAELAQVDDRGPGTPAAAGSTAGGVEPVSPYSPPTAPLSSGPSVVRGGEVVYAGFWKRAAAVMIDSTILAAAGFVIGMVAAVPMILMLGTGDPSGAGLLVSQLLTNLLSIVIGVVYVAWFHSSSSMATLGKMALGIKVVRGDGERITFLRAVGRYFAQIPSALILGIGYLMAAFTGRKQALHDMMCDTLVVDKWAFTDHPDLQRPELGVVGWIVLVLFGGLSLLVLLAIVAAIAIPAFAG